jgi:hypothetical protein
MKKKIHVRWHLGWVVFIVSRAIKEVTGQPEDVDRIWPAVKCVNIDSAVYADRISGEPSRQLRRVNTIVRQIQPATRRGCRNRDQNSPMRFKRLRVKIPGATRWVLKKIPDAVFRGEVFLKHAKRGGGVGHQKNRGDDCEEKSD